MRIRFFCIVLVTLPLCAQKRHDSWRTLDTKHARFHFVSEYAEWTRNAAAQTEAIFDAVYQEVGYELTKPVDIIVIDPLARPNGMAWPDVREPTMILYATPPRANSGIGYYHDWAGLLITHETAHLAHLARPSRHSLRRRLNALKFLPFGISTPRWVSEGYATLIEGKLSGVGRPYGDFRAVLLRRWAQEGRLPSYSAMSSDSRSWLGMSMAYYLGSAYLDWLVAREGEQALKNVWTRQTALYKRDFNGAFDGVFGDSPVKLYRRFSAELTQKAMTMEDATKDLIREGEPWQDLSWGTRRLQLSPDGKQLAAIRSFSNAPSQIIIWSTDDEELEEAKKKRRETAAKLLEADPEDVLSPEPSPFPRTVKHRLTRWNQARFDDLRWHPDGQSLFFVRYVLQSDGNQGPDLFQWWPDSGRVKRITRGEFVRELDIMPDGKRALAVRYRFGASQLVWIDLQSGSVTEMTTPSVIDIRTQPAIDPEGRRAVFLKHHEHRWRLVIRDLEDSSEHTLTMPQPFTYLGDPIWAPDGKGLWLSAGAKGWISLFRVNLDSGAWDRMTLGHRAHTEPMPSRDGSKVYYLAMDGDGQDIYEFDAKVDPIRAEPPAFELHPSTTPDPIFEKQGYRQELKPDRPYGLGPQATTLVFQGVFSPSLRALDIGIKGGDPVGRFDWFVQGTYSSDDIIKGGTAGLRWSGWPLRVRAQAYFSDDQPDRQAREVPLLSSRLNAERSGVNLELDREFGHANTYARLGLGGSLESLEREDGDRDRDWFYLDADHRLSRNRGRLSWGYGLKGLVARGNSEDADLEGHRIGANLWLRFRKQGLRLTAERVESEPTNDDFDLVRVGGISHALWPERATFQRVAVPYLPAGSLLGQVYDRQRIAWNLPNGLMEIFGERHRMEANDIRGDWLEAAGFKLSVTPESFGIFAQQLRGLNLELGAAYLFNGSFEEKVEGWFGMGYRF